MKKILFVDDEPQILDALQDSLRKHRRSWDMTFICGGENALAELHMSAFDVVVTDVRMPLVDGVEVLRCARDNQPNALRIALTGFSNESSKIELTTLAQRYLSKPCDVEELDEAISRDFELITAFDARTVKELAGKSGKLPANGSNCKVLLQRLENSAGSIDDISEIVEQDVAMTAKLLQLSNSSFFRRQQTVLSAKQALSYLGVDVLKALVMSEQMFDDAKELPAVDCFDAVKMHEHSVLTSSIARKLIADSDSTAYTAGLLHDVGKLVILNQKPEMVDALTIKDCRAANAWVSEDEQRMLLGCTHAEVGGYILNLWGLPTPIVEAITFHDSPGKVFSKEFDAVGAVHVANYLAHWATADEECEHIEKKLDRHYLEDMGVLDRLDEWKQLVSDVLDNPEG